MKNTKIPYKRLVELENNKGKPIQFFPIYDETQFVQSLGRVKRNLPPLRVIVPPSTMKKPQLKVRIIHLLAYHCSLSRSRIASYLGVTVKAVGASLRGLLTYGFIYKVRPGINGHQEALYSLTAFPPKSLD